MVKNAIDIIFSGFSFWLVGFGLSFGTDEGTNAFTGVGYFLTEVGTVNNVFTFDLQLLFFYTKVIVIQTSFQSIGLDF